MAGSVQIDYADTLPVRRVALRWLSDSSGNVSGTLTQTLGGAIVGVLFVPAPSASAVQPSDLYDVTLLDEFGLDALVGRGANLSNAAATRVVPGAPMTDGTSNGLSPVTVSGTLELRVANAGNAKRGTVVLYLR